VPWNSPLEAGYTLWAAFVILWNVTERRSVRTAATLAPHRRRVFQLVLVAGLTLMVLAPTRSQAARLWRVSAPLDPGWAFVLIVVGGISFCCWARLHLGRHWSADVARKQDHHIVHTGPYRLVRHPIYTGFIVVYVGLTALCANWLAVLALALLIVGLWLKARAEEQFLIEELGTTAYGDYRARTPMFVPDFLSPS
jgi:protein-S-isoprenylcysteine O-methyltransferase Ste14